MRLITITALLLPSVILAAPVSLDARADESCAPTSYTLSDFTLTTSSSAASVDFNFRSSFANATGIEDSVTSGANCYATGVSIPNNNVCDVADRKLLFDLRAAQDKARYQITHTWVCNGKTWMSGNDVTIDPLACDTVGDVRNCHGGPQTIVPQNVRLICNTPTC